MTKEGFIFLHRKIEEWEWYDDANTFRLFIHCLLEANYTEKQWRGVAIKRGQFITSQPKLANSLKLSVQQIRTALNKLKSTGEITVYTTADYSVITVKNYDDYQQNNSLNNSLITDKQQANNSLITTTNNDNNDNKYRERDRKILEKYLLSRKRTKPIDDIDAYISAIKPQDLEIKLQKALKWYEKQQVKENNQIPTIEPEPQESEEDIKKAIEAAHKKMEEAKKR